MVSIHVSKRSQCLFSESKCECGPTRCFNYYVIELHVRISEEIASNLKTVFEFLFTFAFMQFLMLLLDSKFMFLLKRATNFILNGLNLLLKLAALQMCGIVFTKMVLL